MEREEFEKIVEENFEQLPEQFKSEIDNVAVVVEDYPTDDLVGKLHLKSKHQLFGLYQGVPLSMRGPWYGMSPVLPDKISLYQRNIESVCRTTGEIRKKVYEVLVHEIGHYLGMNEEEIRSAGY